VGLICYFIRALKARAIFVVVVELSASEPYRQSSFQVDMTGATDVISKLEKASVTKEILEVGRVEGRQGRHV
jgi:hypothetical protein